MWKSALTVPSEACASLHERERRERNGLAPERARRCSGRSVISSKPAAPWAAQRHTCRSRGRRARRDRPASRSAIADPRCLWWHAHATRQVPCHRRGRLSSRRGGDRPRRTGHVNGETVTDPARDVTDADTVTVDGAADRVQRRARVYARQQARGRGLDGERPPAAPDRRLARALGGPPVSRGPARHRHHRADPAHQRRRPGPSPHPSQLRGPKHLPRRGLEAARPRPRRAGAARRRRARGRPHRPGAGAPPGRPGRDRSSSRSTRAASARSSACARRSAIACARWNGSRSGRSCSATLAPGAHRRLTEAEVQALSRAGTRARRGAGASSAGRARRPPASG